MRSNVRWYVTVAHLRNVDKALPEEKSRSEVRDMQRSER